VIHGLTLKRRRYYHGSCEVDPGVLKNIALKLLIYFVGAGILDEPDCNSS
jgi:hypothetical protein